MIQQCYGPDGTQLPQLLQRPSEEWVEIMGLK